MHGERIKNILFHVLCVIDWCGSSKKIIHNDSKHVGNSVLNMHLYMEIFVYFVEYNFTELWLMHGSG